MAVPGLVNSIVGRYKKIQLYFHLAPQPPLACCLLSSGWSVHACDIATLTSLLSTKNFIKGQVYGYIKKEQFPS